MSQSTLGYGCLGDVSSPMLPGQPTAGTDPIHGHSRVADLEAERSQDLRPGKFEQVRAAIDDLHATPQSVTQSRGLDADARGRNYFFAIPAEPSSPRVSTFKTELAALEKIMTAFEPAALSDTTRNTSRYFNMHRLYQATFLLDNLRQAAFPNGETPDARDNRVLHTHRVLQVLGRMMASPVEPSSKHRRNAKTVTDTCFPTLATLCLLACLGDSSVRQALGNLITWGFIKKTHDPGHVWHRSKKAVYDRCRYHVVATKWDLVTSPFQGKYEAKLTGVVGPAITPKISVSTTKQAAADQDVIETLDAGVRPRKKGVPEDVELKQDSLLVHLIRKLMIDTFPSHPSNLHPAAMRLRDSFIQDCISHVKTNNQTIDISETEVIKAVLEWALANPKTRAGLEDSRNLYGYASACFSGWLHDWRVETGWDPCNDENSKRSCKEEGYEQEESEEEEEEGSYNKDSYDENGDDKEGFDEDGYDKDGYNDDGLNEDGYDEDGYDKDGYDEDGYDEDGYNEGGYNKDGDQYEDEEYG